MRAGGCGPADRVVVGVGVGGEVAADAGLDAALGTSAADVVAAYRLTGKPGQVAHVLATVGERSVRVAFIGVVGRSVAELRRSGASSPAVLAGCGRAVASAPAGARMSALRMSALRMSALRCRTAQRANGP